MFKHYIKEHYMTILAPLWSHRHCFTEIIGYQIRNKGCRICKSAIRNKNMPRDHN